MIKRLFKIFIFTLLQAVLFIIPMNAQDIKVTAAFDTSKIYIGDQLNFTITVEQPASANLNIQSFKDTVCKNIEILAKPVVDTVFNQDRIKIVNNYLVTSFDSGFYCVPPVYAESRENNNIKRYYSDYSVLEVSRINIAPPDTSSAIYDIIEPYRAPVTIREIVPWLLWAVLAAIVIYGIIRLISFFSLLHKGKEKPVEKIYEPAHVIAFRELDKLKEEELWQKGETKEYYSRLTAIIRQYIDNRFSVNSLELTTQETLTALLNRGFKKDKDYALLKTILICSDLVKFAKHVPDANENTAHYDDARLFVEETKIDETVSDTATDATDTSGKAEQPDDKPGKEINTLNTKTLNNREVKS